MKDTFWNLLTGLVMIGTLLVLVLFLVVFSNPQTFINPLPPPDLPEVLVLPTATATLRSLPTVATPEGFISDPVESGPSATPRPSSTPLPTNTSFVLPSATITLTPTPTETETPTASPTSSAYQCDVVSSFPGYDQVFPPGGDFDGRWTLKNTGTEKWGDNVDLIYISGAKFQTGGDAVDILKSSVATGETTDVIVDMLAPREAGTYKTVWRLRSGGMTFCEVTLQIIVK